jgi:hypothetical protein
MVAASSPLVLFWAAALGLLQNSVICSLPKEVTMAVPKHLDEAASTLKEAWLRIEAARESPASLDSLKEWLAALTDYAQALKDIQEYSNESVHEKLHHLAGRVGIRKFPGEKTA